MFWNEACKETKYIQTDILAIGNFVSPPECAPSQVSGWPFSNAEAC
jgi:hypothetical protein